MTIYKHTVYFVGYVRCTNVWPARWRACRSSMKQCARFAIVASLESRRALTRATTLVTAPPAPGIFAAERSIALPSIPRIMSVKQEMADVTISVSALSRHAAISGMPSASTIKSRLRGSTQQLLRPPIPNATYNATRRRRYHGDHEYERGSLIWLREIDSNQLGIRFGQRIEE